MIDLVIPLYKLLLLLYQLYKFNIDPIQNIRRVHIMSLITVNDNNFKETVEKSHLVLVDFWAPWCGPCKMIAPILDQLDQESAGAVIIAKLNVDDNPETSSHYGVMSIPTLKLFKDGKEVETVVGLQPLENLKKWIQKHA